MPHSEVFVSQRQLRKGKVSYWRGVSLGHPFLPEVRVSAAMRQGGARRDNDMLRDCESMRLEDRSCSERDEKSSRIFGKVMPAWRIYHCHPFSPSSSSSSSLLPCFVYVSDGQDLGVRWAAGEGGGRH